MRYVARKWTCRKCGRANQTMAEPDGTVTCEYCRSGMRIPAGPVRPGAAGKLEPRDPGTTRRTS